MNRKSTVIVLLFVMAVSANLGAQIINNPSVFNSNRGEKSQWLVYKNHNQALYKIITDEAFRLLDERSEKINQLQGQEQWEEYQKRIKPVCFKSAGFFQKTPLNVQVTGKIKRENYTVEKIMFESHPGFFVTGCLFIPQKRQKPAPAIIYCSGHTELSFRSTTYQHVVLNLVDKGFIVFGMDPIGQGERLQYLNKKTGKSKIGGSTKEHTFAGVQTLMTGTSLSDYFIWDGVRTVDFLLTRKEVDGERIGITGRSGGGTQSAEIAAYDDRIYASAPECYITTFKRLLQSIGPQDAEQNILHAIKLGFDHPDYLHIRAPKPTLIITTTHDFFSQQGARECFLETKKSYSAFGKTENIQMVEDYGKHESTKKNREAMYAFFQKHLKNPGDNNDKEVEIFNTEELWVTPKGQLQASDLSLTTYDLNQKYFSQKNISEKQLKEKIKTLSGIDFNRKLSTAVYTGKYLFKETYAEKYFLENNTKDFVLPLYVLNNNPGSDKILLWLNNEGKQSLLENESLFDLIKKGYTIVSADLPGIGELNDPEFSGDGFIQNVPFNYTFGAHLAGKSIAGIYAESIDLLVQFIKDKKQFSGKSLHALIEGNICSGFLHYTTLNNPFEKIGLIQAKSNSDLIKDEYYDVERAYYVVPGSLPYYDTDDLIALLPAGTVMKINDARQFVNP